MAQRPRGGAEAQPRVEFEAPEEFRLLVCDAACRVGHRFDSRHHFRHQQVVAELTQLLVLRRNDLVNASNLKLLHHGHLILLLLPFSTLLALLHTDLRPARFDLAAL